MPTYGYQCEACENAFEVFQKVNEKPTTKCPSCGGKTVRVFYPVGIVFKGSGFYKTDNRKPPAKVEADKKSDTNSETKSKDKTDTKEKKPAQKQVS